MKIDDAITLDEFEEALAEYAKSLAKNESIDESLFNYTRSREKKESDSSSN